ncbi:Uncharacterised protein [Vibrio cholerae]|nr:Uncharacterised protein [Vibrio cholerae]CSB64890.1 Uncharacterised protein [Vibrio cholerae]CSB85174.1 Uncharacterised protein [Vibrio cholerae]CSD16006.1 Uncharacterised protein [Vibrio cholerae]
MILLLSLIPETRLNMLSTKSPKTEITTVNKMISSMTGIELN